MRRLLLAVMADSHFDRTKRWEETCRVHEWIQGDIAERRPDLVIHTGDVYERPSVPMERIKVAELLIDIAQTAPVLVLRGNHDALVDIDIFRALKGKHPIEVEEAYGVHVLGGFAVAALAWPRQAELLRSVGRPVTEREGAELAQTAMRNVIGGMGAELEGPRLAAWPTILAAHAMVRGSITSTGQPLVGCDMELGIEDLALAGADFIALGHIHKGQDWAFNGAPIVYPGSPRRTTFGELEDKGYLVVEFRDEPFDGAAKGPRGWYVKWERVLTPCRRMLLLEATFGEGKLAPDWDLNVDVAGAEVRLTYATDKDQRLAAKAAVMAERDVLLADGAFSVKLEERVHSTVRARAPELADAKTIADKLEIFWDVKGLRLSAERKARLLAIAARLETGVRAES